MRLYFDFEVYSEIDIREAPLDVYAAHPSTEIILCAYAFDDGPVTVWDRSTGASPAEFVRAFRDDSITLVAWNVNYERTVLQYKSGGRIPIPISRWDDPMAMARYAGLPGKLKDCAKVPMLGVPEEAATKSETLLINKFCKPNRMGERTLPSAHPDDWSAFVDYCRRDVLTMRHIMHWLEAHNFSLPPRERRLWELDQTINERGIPVDVGMAVHACHEVNRINTAALINMAAITGLENPNSVQQLHPWLQERGYKYDSLGKEFLSQALENDQLTDEARQVIQLRLDSAKTSVKKFNVIAEKASPEIV